MYRGFSYVFWCFVMWLEEVRFKVQWHFYFVLSFQLHVTSYLSYFFLSSILSHSIRSFTFLILAFHHSFLISLLPWLLLAPSLTLSFPPCLLSLYLLAFPPSLPHSPSPTHSLSHLLSRAHQPTLCITVRLISSFFLIFSLPAFLRLSSPHLFSFTAAPDSFLPHFSLYGAFLPRMRDGGMVKKGARRWGKLMVSWKKAKQSKVQLDKTYTTLPCFAFA